MRKFEFKHIVGFEETNLVGNVYYANYVRWQGRCREMFLSQHAPEVLADLQGDLVMATTRCACEYLAELTAFDRIVIRMTLGGMVQNRVQMKFEYWQIADDGERLVARGEQEIACMRRTDERTVPTQIPAVLRQALLPYQETPARRAG
ncbi:MAG: 4-hydroxybenzoyl-CoA thioesterase [Phycisphaeraceae bacterium]|nr:4-hydroxybenzoyl-CoA thioesterase [Phycisphaeraceae bacterium]